MYAFFLYKEVPNFTELHNLNDKVAGNYHSVQPQTIIIKRRNIIS